MFILYSPDAADVSVWVTEFSQQYSPGPCAGGSSHPVSLYFQVHLQTSSEPGKRGSLHSFQNDPKAILYRESLWKGRRSWREKIHNTISERNKGNEITAVIITNHLSLSQSLWLLLSIWFHWKVQSDLVVINAIIFCTPPFCVFYTLV